MSQFGWKLPVMGVALAAVFLTLRNAIGIDLDPDSVRTVVAGLGIWAPLVFVGIVVFRIPLLVPSALVLMAGGLLFGTTLGTLYGAIGLVVSAMAVFLTARWAGRGVIEKRVPERLRYLVGIAASRAGATFIAVGSAYPMSPITSYHVVAGATGMRITLFFLAAAIGCAARAALYTYFGNSLVEADPTQMAIAGGLLLAALLVPLAFPTTRAWLLGALTAQDAQAGNDAA